MRFAALILGLLCTSGAAVAQQDAATPAGTSPPAADAGRFDGAWDVTLSCSAVEGSGSAKGYIYRFPAQVKDGVLHGRHGAEGSPGWVALDGAIRPDGAAGLEARGLSGDPDYALGHVAKSTPYAYRVEARFNESRGTGRRMGGRPCDLDFVRR